MRLVQAVPDGFVRDLRAVSGGFTNALGVECVKVCEEAEWYGWALTGIWPTLSEVPIDLLWVD
jgi:hypothetical protein